MTIHGSFPRFAAIALAAPAEPAANATGRAVVFFLTVAGLLAIFLIVIVLLGISNRRHLERKKEEKTRLDLDAWKAAGSRAEPIDAGGSDDESDRSRR